MRTAALVNGLSENEALALRWSYRPNEAGRGNHDDRKSRRSLHVVFMTRHAREPYEPKDREQALSIRLDLPRKEASEQRADRFILLICNGV